MAYSGSCDDCAGELVSMMNEGDNNYGCDGDLNNVEDSIVLMTYNDSKGCSLYYKVQLLILLVLCAFLWFTF